VIFILSLTLSLEERELMNFVGESFAPLALRERGWGRGHYSTAIK
jgi:hypothetical protein